MKRKHYLSRKEEELVGSKCKGDYLFGQLRSLALRAERLSGCFSLSPSDLFYHVVCSLDSLVEKITDDEEDEMQYSRDLWQELRSHFAENVDCEEADVELAATLVVCTLYNLLIIGNRAKYDSVVKVLRRGAKEVADGQREQMEKIIDEVLYADKVAEGVRVWMVSYAASDVCLSDEIGSMIISEREVGGVSGVEDSEELVGKLKGYFWNDVGETEKFVNSIYGKDDFTVIDTISGLVNARRPKMLKKNKSALWRILHEYNIYQASQVNFSNQLMKKGY